MARLAEPIDGQGGHFRTHQQLWQTFGNVAFLPPPSTAAVNSANLKAAIADATSGGFGSTVFIPPETYLLNDYHTIANVSGIRIVGAGHRSRLVSTLNSTSHTLFEFDDVRESVIGNLYMTANAEIGGFVRYRNVSGGSVTPSMNTVENVHMECVNRVQYPLILGGMDYVDANNDFNLFDRCYLIGYTAAGAYMRAHSQSYGNEFRGCYFFGGTGAEHAVNAGGNYGGNFAWYGGFVGGHTKADFLIGRSYQPYSILGVNGEVSARFIESDAAHNHIHVEDCRVAANAIHDDGRMIITRGRVKLRLIGNRFGDGVRRVEDENGVLQKIPVVFDFSAANGARVRCIDNEVYSVADQVFVGAVPYVLEGNDRIPDEATGLSVPLTA